MPKRNCIECAYRKIVVCWVPGWGRQGFYQSSGHNSGKPGQWFPFDGCRPGWFIKDRFCRLDEDQEAYLYGRDHSLYRYGYEILRKVGEWLGTQDFVVRETMDYREWDDLQKVNAYLKETGKYLRPKLLPDATLKIENDV